MDRAILFIVGFLLIVTAFLALWPAALYFAQPFNTNWFFAIFGAILSGVALFKKGGKQVSTG